MLGRGKASGLSLPGVRSTSGEGGPGLVSQAGASPVLKGSCVTKATVAKSVYGGVKAAVVRADVALEGYYAPPFPGAAVKRASVARGGLVSRWIWFH